MELSCLITYLTWSGAISEVLSVLSDAKVNVASLNVARATSNTLSGSDSSDPLALCFMALDDDVPPSALAQLNASPTLRSVSMIHL